MAHWARDPTLVQGMFYAFVFQDALHFGICDEDVMADLAERLKTADGWSLKLGWMPTMIH